MNPLPRSYQRNLRIVRALPDLFKPLLFLLDSVILEEIDTKILDVIQQVRRTCRNGLGESVGFLFLLTAIDCRRYEENGIVVGYCVEVEHKKRGKDITPLILTTVLRTADILSSMPIQSMTHSSIPK